MAVREGLIRALRSPCGQPSAVQRFALSNLSSVLTLSFILQYTKKAWHYAKLSSFKMAVREGLIRALRSPCGQPSAVQRFALSILSSVLTLSFILQYTKKAWRYAKLSSFKMAVREGLIRALRSPCGQPSAVQRFALSNLSSVLTLSCMLQYKQKKPDITSSFLNTRWR